MIARRERPHPGAQLTLFDTAEGFRNQVFITDQTDTDIAALELRHRHRAHVENRIRAAKDRAIATRFTLTEKTVETHIGNLLTKLDLPPEPDDHRRVLAVRAWLQRCPGQP